jgi:hypothetical protein
VQLAAVSQKSTIAEAIRYARSRWSSLTHFLEHGAGLFDGAPLSNFPGHRRAGHFGSTAPRFAFAD